MDIYFRNPEAYAQEIQESNVRLLSWDIGDMKKRNIDPLKWAAIHMDNTRYWRMLIIAIEGAAEYDNTSRSEHKPKAVYPTWRWEYGFDKLVDYCANPVGEDIWLCHNENIPTRFRPVMGQPHRVVIYDAPDSNTHEGAHYLRQLMAVKHQFPHVEFIVHNTASYRVMFVGDFAGACFDPRMTAKMGSVILPSGRAVNQNDFIDHVPWIKLLGFTVRDLRSTIFDRVMYNIESVRWANENYRKNVNFRVAMSAEIDLDSPGADYEVARETESWLTTPGARARMQPGDGVICGACSLANVCKYYREGAVCGVPSADGSKLAEMFGTRDAGVIVDGLVSLTQLQATRVQADLADEASTGERLPQTDKRIKDLFDAGVKVAKLIDPTLNGKGTTVNVGVVGAAAIEIQQTPQEMMAGAVRALESHGIPRHEITPEMIRGLLEGVANRNAVHEVIEIEARATGT